MKPLVSIIIVNYNGRMHLARCLDSVKKMNYKNIEVILVDNGSNDGSVEFIEKNYGWVKLIKNRENLGPIIARNMGIKKSKGYLIAFLDNDTEVDKNWLKELVNSMEKDVGVCASKVMLFDNRKLINSAGMGCDIYGFAFSRGLKARGLYEKDVGQYDKVGEVFAAYAAAMLVRKDVLKKVGYLDESFGMYYEEIDLCWRIRLAGYKILYVPKAVVYHKIGGPKAWFTLKNKYYTEKNRFATMIKNYSAIMLIKIIPLYLMMKFFELMFYLFFRKIRMAAGIILALMENIKGLPNVLKERKKIGAIRKVDDKGIIKHMVKGSMEFYMFMKGYGKYVIK